jgi:hypothetical protein
MDVTVLDQGNNRFSLNGVCPHCRRSAVFMMATNACAESVGDSQWRLCAAMDFQGCRKYILGIVLKQGGPWGYLEHYPLATPDDSVDKNVPVAIATDFSEALRCLWVKEFRASVAMCRRALQSSCDDLKAQGKNLFEQIDDLAKKGIITEPLKKLAHRVRLTANKELHASGDDLGTIEEKDAEAIIAFTREYFHHVYVMPALLNAYESAAAPPTAP